MKEFLKRLKTLALYIGGFIVAVSILLAEILFLENASETTLNILGWVIGIPLGSAILFAVAVIVNWLFIEPFRKNKEKLGGDGE
ncbi:hypothetical protein ACU3L3_07125 [Priestia endophytica]